MLKWEKGKGGENMELTTALTEFPGVGPARAKALAKLGLTTAGDLLEYFPRDYEDRRQFYDITQAPEGLPVCSPPWWRLPPPLPTSARG